MSFRYVYRIQVLLSLCRCVTARQFAKLTIIFHITVITNVNFAKKNLYHPPTIQITPSPPASSRVRVPASFRVLPPSAPPRPPHGGRLSSIQRCHRCPPAVPLCRPCCPVGGGSAAVQRLHPSKTGDVPCGTSPVGRYNQSNDYLAVGSLTRKSSTLTM